jgi:hypothetical protein
MNRRFLCCFGIVCCAVFVILKSTSALADEPAAKIGEELQNFGDKIVVISIELTVGNERYSSSATLKNAKLIRLGDRTFIRGTGYVDKGDKTNERIAWFDGIDASYAWDGVVDFYVFTPDQLAKYREWIRQTEVEKE